MKPRHTAKIRLSAETLERLLDLPPNTRLVAVDSTNDPFSVHLVVENPNLPEVPPEAESPFVRATFVESSHVRPELQWEW